MLDEARPTAMFEIVKALTELPGPTGHEDRVQDWIAARWEVCSQQVISRMLRPDDQLFYWGGAGLLAVLQREEDLPAVRSELMRVLAVPVNQYFETEHRTIYLPIRMAGEVLPVTGTLPDLQEQIQKYFSARS